MAPEPQRGPSYHAFVKEGRFASLLVRDHELADSLAEGFQELWRKAMKNLREIQVDPQATRPDVQSRVDCTVGDTGTVMAETRAR